MEARQNANMRQRRPETRTHSCAGRKTWARSRTSPPPPWTEGTPRSGAWTPSNPCKASGLQHLHRASFAFGLSAKRVPVSPFEVFLLLAETRSGQSRRGFTQVANKVIAEVEGQRVLVGQEPPDGRAARDGSRRRFHSSV